MLRLGLVLLLSVWCASAAAQTQPVIRVDPLAPGLVLSNESRSAYEAGRLVFNGHWRPAGTSGPDGLVGLGPLYNRISCASCHNAGGRGRPPPGPRENFLTAIVRIGVLNEQGTVQPHPLFGTQIQDRAIPDVAPEAELSLTWREVPGTYPDGTSYSLRKPDLTITPNPGPDARWSIRIAQPVHGVGLLARAVTPQDGSGRFGWKALMPSLVAQNAHALAHDMGITSLFEPDPICPKEGEECQSGPPEISGVMLSYLTLFTRLLAPPVEGPTTNPQGQVLFSRTGCAICHVPQLPMRDSPDMVTAYSDLALHDMGPGLDDGLPEGRARSSEWRTPPLWGLGRVLSRDSATPLLHDGRARGVEEAILWHDGDARAARDAFMALAEDERAALLAFISGL